MIEGAWDQGVDALRITSPGGDVRYVVRSTELLRRPSAAFYPAQRNSSNLLAGVAPYAVPFGLLSGGLLGMPPDDVR